MYEGFSPALQQWLHSAIHITPTLASLENSSMFAFSQCPFFQFWHFPNVSISLKLASIQCWHLSYIGISSMSAFLHRLPSSKVGNSLTSAFLICRHFSDIGITPMTAFSFIISYVGISLTLQLSNIGISPSLQFSNVGISPMSAIRQHWHFVDVGISSM